MLSEGYSTWFVRLPLSSLTASVLLVLEKYSCDIPEIATSKFKKLA